MKKILPLTLVLLPVFSWASVEYAVPSIVPKGGMNGSGYCYDDFKVEHKVYFTRLNMNRASEFAHVECQITETVWEDAQKRTRVLRDWGICIQGANFMATDSCGEYSVHSRGVSFSENGKEYGPISSDKIGYYAD